MREEMGRSSARSTLTHRVPLRSSLCSWGVIWRPCGGKRDQKEGSIHAAAEH